MKRTIKGILFDKDGTLLQFEPVWIDASHQVFARLCMDYGLEYETGLDRFDEAIGIHGDSVDSDGQLAIGTYHTIARAVAFLFPDADVEELEERETLYYSRALEEKSAWPLTFDVKKLFSWLNERQIHIGIASTDYAPLVTKMLVDEGLMEYVSFLSCADSGWSAKPDPEGIHRAAEYWNVKESEIAVCGDTPNDMQFARNGGAYAIGVLSGTGTRKELEKSADLILDKAEDLMKEEEKNI